MYLILEMLLHQDLMLGLDMPLLKPANRWILTDNYPSEAPAYKIRLRQHFEGGEGTAKSKQSNNWEVIERYVIFQITATFWLYQIIDVLKPKDKNALIADCSSL